LIPSNTNLKKDVFMSTVGSVSSSASSYVVQSQDSNDQLEQILALLQQIVQTIEAAVTSSGNQDPSNTPAAGASPAGTPAGGTPSNQPDLTQILNQLQQVISDPNLSKNQEEQKLKIIEKNLESFIQSMQQTSNPPTNSTPPAGITATDGSASDKKESVKHEIESELAQIQALLQSTSTTPTSNS
jgi:hypothetical protein